MTQKQALRIFQKNRVRAIWDDEAEKWYIAIVDVIAVLTDSVNPQTYWRVLKKRLINEGNESVTNCNALKLQAADGKMRMTNVADIEQLFRLIQSIPSPKAEPFKLWLADVAKERMDQFQDPELSIDQAIRDYRNLGYSENWINQRIKSIEVRKELTDEWNSKGVTENSHFAMLTNIITKEWSGLTVKEYKSLKNLKKENLRDNMTNTELILNMLAEASTTEISQATNPSTIGEHKIVAKRGGSVAKNARKELERSTKRPIVSSLNAKKISKKINKELDD